MGDTLCIDIDWIPPPEWMTAWRTTRHVLYAALGYTVLDMRQAISSSGKGIHVWISLEETLDEDTRNMLQWLGADDPTRVRINRLRTQRGMKRMWNKLFSEVRMNLDYRGRPPNCSECKILKYLKEMSSRDGRKEDHR